MWQLALGGGLQWAAGSRVAAGCRLGGSWEAVGWQLGLGRVRDTYGTKRDKKGHVRDIRYLNGTYEMGLVQNSAGLRKGHVKDT